MAELIRKAQQKVDNFLTNYLRNTTTDQEILNFYGEGNIVGRKGIPATDKELLDIVEASGKLNYSPLRPDTGRKDFAVGGIDQGIKYDYKTNDIPGVVNPATGRPWQMTFGTLPKDFGSSSLTPAAKQFLVDFRIPVNAGNDYSFATGPNLIDRIETETENLKQNDPYYGRQPEKLKERITDIQNQSEYIGDFGGQPQTPRTWQERGYITEKPTGFKENVLNKFKNNIFETQGPFGGVSTLTPVEQVSASNPNWRADIYQREGLAGPLSDQGFSSGYGGGSKDVQRFTTGKERILPLQPYTEFFQRLDSTSPSVLKTAPAPDFTPFQKAIGPRNYLIGQNILAGRGSLGAPVRVVQATPAAFRSSVRPATAGLLLDAGINYALGASPQEALATAGTDLISAEGLGGAPTAAIERRGPRGEFVDTRSNTVLSPKGVYTKTGIAYKNGKPIIVPRGSVAGEGNIITQTQSVLKNAAEVWRKRLGALGIFGR
jgi:hypothetical protein